MIWGYHHFRKHPPRPWRALDSRFMEALPCWRVPSRPSARHVPWQRDEKVTWTLQKITGWTFFWQPVKWWFPTISYIKIWFIIQLKQPFIQWLFGVPGTHVINVLVFFHSDPARAELLLWNAIPSEVSKNHEAWQSDNLCLDDVKAC